ncbi:MAG: hypothetical protein SNH79_07220 [Rikenellaceae bacterium]
MTVELINEAKRTTFRTIRSKEDAFIVLSALNLLNAAVKNKENKEYQEIAHYGFIKPSVVKFFLQCIDKNNVKYIDEASYNAKEQCLYIRCLGIQFSFHNIDVISIDNFINSLCNKQVSWDGIRLQPIAVELYELAKSIDRSETSPTDILGRVQDM